MCLQISKPFLDDVMQGSALLTFVPKNVECSRSVILTESNGWEIAMLEK